MKHSQPCNSDVIAGPIDRPGAGDHDQPYRFGRRPRTDVPFPFNARQYAKLLVLRSRFQEGTDPIGGADDMGSLPVAA